MLGTINVYVNGGSSGNSIETTVVQLTADALGANIDDVATIPQRMALVTDRLTQIGIFPRLVAACREFRRNAHAALTYLS
jgi:CO/xanthine dehydrogenase Mo-binding subunit